MDHNTIFLLIAGTYTPYSLIALRGTVGWVLFGIIWGIVLFGVALIITNFKDYELRDVLFVEGIIFVVGGVLSSIGGNPMGLSMQGLGQNNAQYIANANLEVSKMEKDKTNNIKTTISAGLSTVSLIIGGLLVIAINFII